MNAIAALSTATGTSMAEVLARQGAEITLLRQGERVAARRAVSCLVAPEPGDLVLLGGPDTRPYVLAVLERAGAAPVCLAVEGDMRIAAGGTLALNSAALKVTADTGVMTVGALAVAGGTASARFGAITLVADAIESLVTRLMTRAKRSYRFVEESEQLRAADIDYRADGHLHLRGETSTVQARVLVKMDANQIHMG
ncbi:MAG: DUF3540 domain-containing protein [Pseudomonadota bacterium]